MTLKSFATKVLEGFAQSFMILITAVLETAFQLGDESNSRF